MAQHRRRKRLDVFDRNRIAALEHRPRFGAENKILRSARPGAPLDELLDKLRRVAITRSRALRQRDGIRDHVLRHRHAAHQFLAAQDCRAIHHLVR